MDNAQANLVRAFADAREQETPVTAVAKRQTGNLSEQFFEQLVEAPGRLVAIHTKDADHCLAPFRTMSRRTGRAVYLWTPDQGLSSTREDDFTVPRTQRLVDAVNYVLKSIHYGIYVFRNFERELRHPALPALKRVASGSKGAERKIILIGESIALPQDLSDLTVHIVHKKYDRPQPKLRNGRWVV